MQGQHNFSYSTVHGRLFLVGTILNNAARIIAVLSSAHVCMQFLRAGITQDVLTFRFYFQEIWQGYDCISDGLPVTCGPRTTL